MHVFMTFVLVIALTCPKLRHRRRREPVARVARPQLPVGIVAPAVDSAAGQQAASVKVSEGDHTCVDSEGGDSQGSVITDRYILSIAES